MNDLQKFDYSITFACLNQSEYTKRCLESLRGSGIDLSRVVAVDNASTDNTLDVISAFSQVRVIKNRENLGCGTAWNQGTLDLQAEWTVVMNNDILVASNWLDQLFESALRYQLKVVCPAMIEGAADYDVPATLLKLSGIGKDLKRFGDKHAVCMLIHKSVWKQVGYFRSVPKLLGFEDTLFFHELDKHHVPSAIVGNSWIHHFGSVTQSEMKKERGLKENEGLGHRKNYLLLNQSWLQRKLAKIKRTNFRKSCRAAELQQAGISLHGIKENGKEVVWTA